MPYGSMVDWSFGWQYKAWESIPTAEMLYDRLAICPFKRDPAAESSMASSMTLDDL